MQQSPEQEPRSPRQRQEYSEGRPRGAGRIIVGFDNDPLTIFDTQIRFIQASGVVTAMVGILIALPRTQLYERLKKEHRLLNETSGNNTDVSTNFIPRMGYDLLISGYKKVLSTLYSPRHYYQRIKIFLREYAPRQEKKMPFRFRPNYLAAFIRSILFWGSSEKSGSTTGGFCSGRSSAVPASLHRPLPSRSTVSIFERSLRNGWVDKENASVRNESTEWGSYRCNASRRWKSESGYV